MARRFKHFILRIIVARFARNVCEMSLFRVNWWCYTGKWIKQKAQHKWRRESEKWKWGGVTSILIRFVAMMKWGSRECVFEFLSCNAMLMTFSSSLETVVFWKDWQAWWKLLKKEKKNRENLFLDLCKIVQFLRYFIWFSR